MRKTHWLRRDAALLAAGALVLSALSACAPEPSASGGAGPVSITFMTTADDVGTAGATALAEAFMKENSGITVTITTHPAGTDGDNLVKTKLATGEMDDVFLYNTGALLSAINPDQNLVDLSGQPWFSQVTDDFKSTVAEKYGAPIGTSQAGGILYNKKVYAQLNLSIPTSWKQFMDNCAAIKAAGIDPVVQTYGTNATFSSQLWVLADFANVLAVDPQWATEYTAHKRSFTQQPAFAGFDHMEQAAKAGYFNKDFASATLDDGVKMMATAQAVHYPMLTGLLPTIVQNYPDNVNDIGYFALPADDPANTRATLWEPSGLYIPKTTTGAELDAAQKLIAFINSPAGCEIQNEKYTPSGPYVISTCRLPSTVAPALTDLQAYVDKGQAAPALEFLSPVKGPNLEKILIEEGTGQVTAAQAAASYDQDVEAQAQQLNLPGW